MRFLFFILFTLFVQITFAQKINKSEFNKNTTFTTKFDYDTWIYSYNKGTESKCFEQTPVGYMKSYNLTNQLLNFYDIDVNKDLVKKENLIHKGTELDNFEDMPFYLTLEKAYIGMVWDKGNIRIAWYCVKTMNMVMIIKR